MTTQTVTQISAAARGKWPVILQMLRIDVPENGRHGSCPKCGGKDRFRLDDLDGRGTWICSQCGNGDGLDLVKLMTGYGVRKAAQEVAQVLNVPDVQELPVKPARQKAPKRDMSLTVAALMKESHTGESPYLNGKGFAGQPPQRCRHDAR
ncbi:primase-helicase zinc-binding domain-containing protein [Salmonella enterica subsp. enterica serovar Newport]